MNRREIVKLLGLGGLSFYSKFGYSKNKSNKIPIKPIVLSTWHNQSIKANPIAWQILSQNGSALDAVENGVQVCENDINNCCVGLGAYPDRDGFVTLDASIMNHQYEIGAVAALERIKSPIHTARMVMEKTPHVFIVGKGAQDFALNQGQNLESSDLSPNALNAYQNWLSKSEYQPKINIEKNQNTPPANEFNHDTIGMIAMDANGNLSGACTTSGMAFKMHGRVGDSPVIGAGLYVDNAIGAATATGHGEEVIRTCGSFLVVEYMRRGFSPEKACKLAVERIKQITPRDPKSIQVGFIALNKKGEFGAYALQKGFDFGVNTNDETKKFEALALI
ncbi:MAG: N(4)-(beta-N-acetylglucosaminyl)-L-asparaginase [Bacteroidia bacterium]|nr:N(4)-(beta-N-acetylglucosaminyl)-L-asparaginase [Bacteroidia bacterium]